MNDKSLRTTAHVWARDPETCAGSEKENSLLRIRDSQLEVFRDVNLRTFEDRVIGHLQRCFAQRYERVGEQAARAIVRSGVGQARLYGISAERDVCKFVDLMIVFGSGFHSDSNLVWASSILNANEIPAEERLTRLFGAAKAHLLLSRQE